jgi:hypothetical protein
MNEQEIRQIVEAIEKAVRGAACCEPSAPSQESQPNPKVAQACCGETASSTASAAPRVIAVCLC